MKLYPEVNANEWVQPVKKNYKMACCDCGLIHEMDFRIVKNRVQFRARRNNRATGQFRRYRFNKNK
jgi:hypothetical protein